jgi:hypothetical protein
MLIIPVGAGEASSPFTCAVHVPMDVNLDVSRAPDAPIWANDLVKGTRNLRFPL